MAQAHPVPPLVPARARRLDAARRRCDPPRRDGLLPRRGRGGPRGGRRPGPRGRHRAGPLPLPVPRRERVPPGDLAGLPAPRRRARAGRRARARARCTTWRRSPATRPSATPRPTARRVEALARRRRARRGPRPCAASPWNWSAWPTTPATWARWPATSAILPTASFCGRLRGDFLNMTALLCGNRFGRGLVRPGRRRVRRWTSAARGRAAGAAWTPPSRTSANAVNLLWETPSVMARFEETGRRLRARLAEEHRPGRPGRARLRPGARRRASTSRPASTASRTSRSPPGTPATSSPGPTCAGWRSSGPSAFIRDQLRRAARGPDLLAPVGAARAGLASPSRWSKAGAARSATWPSPTRTAGSRATRSSTRRSTTGSAWPWRCADQQISDFPLCNKSFNLSYCGHDL